MKIAALALTSLAAVQAQTPIAVTFLHINDHHSHFEELSFDIRDSDFIPDTLGVNSTNIRMFYGGFPRTVGLMTALSEDAVAAGNDVIKVHAGDALTGTIFYTFFGPKMDAAAMNAASFDAFVVGNHEFDEGDNNLAEFIKMLDPPALSSNLVPAETSALRSLSAAKTIKPFMLKELSTGEQMGICGITIKVTTEQSSFPDEGTTINDEVESATACVADLEVLGVDKILILSHIGYTNDLEWLVNIPGVDVVIGGHSHSLLGGDDFEQLGFPTKGPYAEIINGTCVVSAWEYTRTVGALTVSFDENGVVTECAGATKIAINPDKYTVRDADPRFDLEAADAAIMTASLLGLPASPFRNVPADEDTITALSPFFEKVDEVRLEVIAQAPEPICHTYSEPDPICPDGVTQNWLSGGVCNLVSEGFLLNVPTADVAIQNRGGCRTDILQGDVTFGAVFDILPFSNTLVTFEMTGEQIRLLLEDSVNFFLDPELAGGLGSYPFAAGLRFDIDKTAEFGMRITNLEINPRLEGEWMPIASEETYEVVTNSFIASGRDGYFTFLDVADTLFDTFIEYGQSFVNYAREVGVIVEPPLSQFSTQKLRLLDGTVYSVEDAAEPMTTESPTVAPSSAAAVSGHSATVLVGLVAAMMIGM